MNGKVFIALARGTNSIFKEQNLSLPHEKG